MLVFLWAVFLIFFSFPPLILSSILFHLNASLHQYGNHFEPQKFQCVLKEPQSEMERELMREQRRFGHIAIWVSHIHPNLCPHTLPLSALRRPDSFTSLKIKLIWLQPSEPNSWAEIRQCLCLLGQRLHCDKCYLQNGKQRGSSCSAGTPGPTCPGSQQMYVTCIWSHHNVLFSPLGNGSHVL